jgi:GR25 family glycosyltransferase involved in LPS biosynthesis
MSTICLSMIIKNHEDVIQETLKNIVKHIKLSYWVICDIGSSDNTRKIITDFFEKEEILGEFLDHKYVDFGHNNTLAIQASYKKADYIFIFDPEDEIHGDLDIPYLTHDIYKLKFGPDLIYYRPLLINAHKESKFVGFLHEFVELEQNASDIIIKGDYYIESCSKVLTKDKYLKDALLLKEAYSKKVENGSINAGKYAFYCAENFKKSGNTEDSIEWYTIVVEKVKNFFQEKYYSCLMLGNMYMKKDNLQKSLEYLLKAEQFDSDRSEGIFFAVENLKKAELHSLVLLMYEKYQHYNKNPLNKLFLFKDYYNDSLEFNTSISAFICKNNSLAYSCIKKIILNNIAVPGIINMSFKNLRFNIPEINQDPDTLELFYRISTYIQTSEESQEINMLWNMLFEKNRSLLTAPKEYNIFPKSNENRVLLSFTSCKRLDLFTETVNSILNHWEDINEIDYWFCVDDNSSIEDREKMTSQYPFINFYMKKPEEKGHRISMNIIWNKLNEMKPKYWIHIEDDFLFYIKGQYIKNSIKFLESQTVIKQVLFNRAYAETIEDLNMRGYTPVSKGFVVHDHSTDSFSYRNCHYWPHYSFRPGIVETSVILELGNYDSNNTFFEMDYAYKWINSGYKTGFFDLVCCRHIGRLTSERNNKIIKNAYDLNNESQFNNSRQKYPVKVVNLKRRQDRKDNIVNLFKSINFTEYEFFEGVDGKELKKTAEIIKLFRGNDFGNRRGFIGCALSNYNLWKELLNDTTTDYYLILEDDIVLSDNFKETYEYLKKNNIFKNSECFFIGYHMFSQNRQKNKDIYNQKSDNFTIDDLKNDLYIGGTFAYSINKKGARNILNYIESNGIKHGIDYVMKICNDIKKTELRPQIVFSDWFESTEQKIDTDIQTDFSSLDLSMVNNISDADFTFISGYDQHDNDLFFDRVSLEEAKQIAILNDDCAGFNTLGFFKKKIDINNLQFSQYFGKNDGLYVKNVKTKNTSYPKIKLIGNWQSCEKMIKEFSVMPHEGLELTTKDDADYYVIVNYPNSEFYKSEKTIIFQMEPWVNDETKNWGVKTWGCWANPNNSNFLHVNSHRNFLNPAQWTFTENVEKFQEKKDRVSIILSEKINDVGHKLRVEFLRQNNIIFDIYGRYNYHSLASYVSPILNDNKYNVYSNYKYVLAVENNSEFNYATEKIWEPLLCECLAFYWGCPNLETYINPKAFVRLPLENIYESSRIVEQAIREDWWSQRIDVIREEKKKIINELGFFPLIKKIIEKSR